MSTLIYIFWINIMVMLFCVIRNLLQGITGEILNEFPTG